MQAGLHPHTCELGRQIVREAAERARAARGDGLLAMGVYGSIAQGRCTAC